ncbi:hypothetical protein H9638_16635 [Arthrobacter sp. Sa2BUA2]|uniref:Uncharacterized protein n=1 Tax=Arthrobacter pullicola TaxID=2762224 RepID=A0ABR8YMG7_9MICC|nr:hypothetical protein [Arthrobacter pullicola]MBD8045434.1 hypothetical protein [Arthrobacter pullicola]
MIVLLGPGPRRIGEAVVNASGPVHLHPLEIGRSGAASIVRRANLVGSCNVAVAVHFRFGNTNVVDNGIADPAKKWQIWQGKRSITYLLEEPPSPDGEDRLCVGFSAISSPYDFSYNYRASLSSVNAYRLFILDNFGNRGSYYYADHRNTDIFDSVQEFLSDLCSQLGIDPSNVSFIGSSKGGTAALAHGIRFGVGNIIVGAPQSLPGTYLGGAAPEILQFIAGDNSEASVEWLDGLLFDVLERVGGSPRIRILVGANDAHLRVHVRPLLHMAQRAGLDASVLIVNGLTHQDVGKAFAPYVTAALRDPGAIDVLLPYRFARRSDANEVQLKLWLPPGEAVDVIIETSSRVLFSADCSSQTYFKVPVPDAEMVRAVVSRRIAGKATAGGSFVTDWLQPDF